MAFDYCGLIVTDRSAYNWSWIAQHAPLIAVTNLQNRTK